MAGPDSQEVRRVNGLYERVLRPLSMGVLAATCAAACAVSEVGQPVPPLLTDEGDRSYTSIPFGRLQVVYMALERELARAKQLEKRLSEREQEIEQLRSEVSALQAQEAETRATLEKMQQETFAAAQVAAASTSPVPRVEATGEPSPSAGPQSLGSNPSDDSAALVAALQAELDSERRERAQVESELEQLREETSVGPFDSAPQKALEEARQRIADLENALNQERQARDALATEYEKLRARAEAPAPEEDSALQAEIEQLKAEQQRVLANIERDLEASRKREKDLEEALAEARRNQQGASPEVVNSLKADNAALQARLDEEHRRNQELSAKLKMATRVTDLIFKIQAERERQGP
jgi:chromosome segregation ATPase